MNVKKGFCCFMVGAFMFVLTGCGTKVEEKQEQKEEAKGNCVATECIKQIKSNNTVEEINTIIGFEGEKSEYSEKYTWKLDSKTSIVLDISSTSPILQATLNKEELKSDAVDFGVYNDIKELLNKGTKITYAEMVEKLGGVEGTLAGRTENSDRYIWVDKHDRTFGATFSNDDGKCTIISLR